MCFHSKSPQSRGGSVELVFPSPSHSRWLARPWPPLCKCWPCASRCMEKAKGKSKDDQVLSFPSLLHSATKRVRTAKERLLKFDLYFCYPEKSCTPTWYAKWVDKFRFPILSRVVFFPGHFVQRGEMWMCVVVNVNTRVLPHPTLSLPPMSIWSHYPAPLYQSIVPCMYWAG